MENSDFKIEVLSPESAVDADSDCKPVLGWEWVLDENGQSKPKQVWRWVPVEANPFPGKNDPIDSALDGLAAELEDQNAELDEMLARQQKLAQDYQQSMDNFKQTLETGVSTFKQESDGEPKDAIDRLWVEFFGSKWQEAQAGYLRLKKIGTDRRTMARALGVTKNRLKAFYVIIEESDKEFF